MGDLSQKGLTVYPLRDTALSEAEQLAFEDATVSLQDTSIVVLAQRLGAILLTDDRPLRELAKRKGLDVHGSLWALEQLVLSQKITAAQLCEAISKMLDGRRRLPQDEIQRMRKQWRC